MDENEESSNRSGGFDQDDRSLLPPEIRQWLTRYWDSPRLKSKWTDIATVILTAAIAVFAGWSAYLFDGQLQEMHKATITADKNFRIDERAWIGFSLASDPVTFTFGKPFLVPAEVLNTGKTPAKDLEGNVAVRIVEKDRPIDFSYAPGHANFRVQGGTIFPGGKIIESFEGIQHGEENAEPIIITKAIGQEIIDGQLFVIIHGRITYQDEFGTEHWTTFCRNVSDPSAISEDCTRYNSTDDNQ
jgi:hypothetical protein